jgi:hypothetical protein
MKRFIPAGFLFVAGLLSSSSVCAAESIRTLVPELLQHCFSILDLPAVIERVASIDADRDVWAPLSTAYTCSDVPGEMRSIELRVRRSNGGWYIRFAHRRDAVDGVPATPR